MILFPVRLGRISTPLPLLLNRFITQFPCSNASNIRHSLIPSCSFPLLPTRRILLPSPLLLPTLCPAIPQCQQPITPRHCRRNTAARCQLSSFPPPIPLCAFPLCPATVALHCTALLQEPFNFHCNQSNSTPIAAPAHSLLLVVRFYTEGLHFLSACYLRAVEDAQKTKHSLLG